MRGDIYLHQKKYAAALAEYDSALNVATSGYLISWWCHCRALAHFHLGHYEQALAQVARAVEIRPDDICYLIWISPDLMAYCPDEKFRAGMLALASKTIERTHGKAGGYTTRGLLYAAYKQYNKAAADYSKAIETVTDEKDRSGACQLRFILQSMHDLAHAYQDAGRLREAVGLFEQSLEKTKAKLGPDHSDALKYMGCLAGAYQEAGKLDQAERLLRDLLERRRNKDGAQSADTAGVLASLGLHLLKQQRYTEAEPLLCECLAIREQKLPDNWLRFNAMSLRGGALLGQQKYPEAEPLLLQGYEGMQQREAQIPPLGKRRLAEAIERLVQLYEATQQPEKARAWREKLPPEKTLGKKE
jgi:tetratricopeptide (TPR) repeat protein